MAVPLANSRTTTGLCVLESRCAIPLLYHGVLRLQRHTERAFSDPLTFQRVTVGHVRLMRKTKKRRMQPPGRNNTRSSEWPNASVTSHNCDFWRLGWPDAMSANWAEVGMKYFVSFARSARRFRERRSKLMGYVVEASPESLIGLLCQASPPNTSKSRSHSVCPFFLTYSEAKNP